MEVTERAEIARRVRAARAFAGLTQEDLGRQVGVDNKTINRWERRHFEPDVGRMKAIVVACGVRPDWFDESFSLSDQPAGLHSNAPGAGGAVGFEPPDLSVADESAGSDRTRA